MSAADVLGRFLRSLGVADSAVPAEVEERAALYRSTLACRRVLVVLDDARDVGSIRPLLPAGAGNAVLVTSRCWLTGLEAAHRAQLDVLDAEDAQELFERIVGADRVHAERAAADRVLAVCAGLPLALRIAGGRLAARPGWAIGDLAEDLADAARRLDELQVDDLAVRASFEVSYATLPPAGPDTGMDPPRAFRLLGLWNGADISLPAAAALLGQSEDDTQRAMELLLDVHLLESPSRCRYRLHDLLRLYAAEQARRQENPQDQYAAVRRLLLWYLHAAAASDEFAEDAYTRRLSIPPAGRHTVRFSGADHALSWCQTERANLITAVQQAARTGLDAIAWMLAVALGGFYMQQSCYADWRTVAQSGLASARASGDLRGQALLHRSLGVITGQLNQFDQTLEHAQRAIALFREAGDQIGEATSLKILGIARAEQGSYAEAIGYFAQAVASYRRSGPPHGHAGALANLAEAYRRCARYDDAVEAASQAMAIYAGLDHTVDRAHLLATLGDVYTDLGCHDAAITSLQQALVILQLNGSPRGIAETLAKLGRAQHAASHPGQAQRSWQQSQRILSQIGVPPTAFPELLQAHR